MTPNDFKDQTEEVLKKLRIEDVVSEYIQLRKVGRRFAAVCPFHNDKDPSLSVNPDKGFWHCFGCGAGGNLFSFIMKIENMTFTDALNYLAGKAGVTIELDAQKSADYRLREDLKSAIRESAVFYHERLFSSSGKDALEYLRKRGLSDSSIRRFGLGYAPSGRTNLCHFLESKGFDPEHLFKSGMVSRWEDGSLSDYFRNRITIPILDHMGRFIAMGGRILDDSGPKYINSPETPVYRKSDHLFGLNLTKQAIVKADSAVLVEGYFDLIALWQYGITNAVASLGTSLTSSQAHLLRKFCGNAVLAYDADGAGRIAAGKGLDIFQSAGIAPKVAVLEAGNDPDSFLHQKGAGPMIAIIENSLDIIDYHISVQRELNDLSTPAGKSVFVKEVMAVIAKMKDPVIIAEYIKRISEEADVSETVLRSMLKGRPYGYDSPVFQPKSKISTPEEKILEVIFQYPMVIARVGESLSLADIGDERLRRIYEILFSIAPKEEISAEDFSGYANEEGLINKIMELVMSENLQVTSEVAACELVDELLLKIRDNKMLSRLQELKKEVEAALLKNDMGHDDERFIEYQRLYQYFKGRK